MCRGIDMTKLGRLKMVELRKAWIDEANDFTPWLAQEENLELLGNELELDLELEAQEQRVGPFRADILCKDTATGNWVLIENQIERTDHSHLGQLITYAAGLKAVTIVWIADKFTEEHRSAMDWLNEISSEDVNFFGLEIELWQIGDSEIAPKFNVVSKPNEWSRTVSGIKQAIEHGELSDTQQLQLEFWTDFREFMIERKSPVKTTKAWPANWMSIAIGRSNFYVTPFVNTVEHRIGVILVMGGPHGEAHFHLLNQEKETIEEELGYQLEWFENPGKIEKHIRKQLVKADPWIKEKWPEYRDFLANTLEDFNRVFRKRIKQLRAEDYRPENY
jgi:hypothetical protein